MIPVSPHIVEGCKNGDRLCQRQLYDHCYEDMLKLCQGYCFQKEDAGGLYNTAMLKVFGSIHTCRETASLMGWIRRIVVNTCIDHCRRQVKPAMHPAGEPREEDVMISPEVYSKISAEETLQLVKELPVNTGLVFNLFVIEGYSHEEIGELLGIAAGTSKWHLNEARRLLKQKLELLYQTKKYSYVS